MICHLRFSSAVKLCCHIFCMEDVFVPATFVATKYSQLSKLQDSIYSIVKDYVSNETLLRYALSELIVGFHKIFLN